MISSCVICLDPAKPLTEEHIFPEAMGGRITKWILCKECNSALGQHVDAPYLQQLPIKTMRAHYSIQGKTGKIPIPFTDVFDVQGVRGNLKIKLNEALAPKIVGSAPNITVGEDGKVTFEVSVDEDDRAKLPSIIKSSLQRFFKSERGLKLGFTAEQQQKNIADLSELASRIPMVPTPTGRLEKRKTVDLIALHTEAIKVIYEICCLEYEDSFIESPQGKTLRQFLRDSIAGQQTECNLLKLAAKLQVAWELPPEMIEVLDALSAEETLPHHIVYIGGGGVACRMPFARGTYVFHSSKPLSFDKARVYLNYVSGSHRVFEIESA